MISEIYLDANATTPVLPEAAQEAISAMEQLFGNPSSSHITGLRARSILESARSLARSALGTDAGRIVFTSGATEAIQMGIFSTLCTVRNQRLDRAPDHSPRYLLYGATEHKAVPQALQHWNELLGIGNIVRAIPVDQHGRLDLEFLRQYAPQADIVCTMAVNNETGVIHDLSAIEAVIRTEATELKWLVDCVQAVGKMQLNLDGTSIDYAAVSGHKIYGPKGIGLLYARDGAPIVPLLAGGGQESGARGGTENLPGVAAIARIFECLNDPTSTTFSNQAALRSRRDRLVAALETAFPAIVFNTPFEHSVPTTINFSVQGLSGKEILDLFDAASIRVSSGSACGSAIVGSYVLEAMGLPKWQSEGAIRLSFGPLTPDSDIVAAEQRIVEAGRALSDSCLLVGQDIEQAPGNVVDGLVQLKRGSDCSWVLLDANSQRCIIIDPFESLAERIETLVRCQKSRIIAIIDSHNHVDHESCRTLLLKALSDITEPSAVTDDILGWPENADGRVTIGDHSEAEFIRFNQDTVIARTALPGHTTDGMAFLVGQTEQGHLAANNVQLAFTGDTLLIGGIGRTDFHPNSASKMFNSLRKLTSIVQPKTLICPTHDYTNGFATTLEAELNGNEFLRQIVDPSQPISLSEFTVQKERLDGHIDDEANCELVCGHIQTNSGDCSSIDISPEDLPEFFAGHENSLIVDVREAHEFRFAQNWDSLGLNCPPENIPLTRLSNFLMRILSNDDPTSKDRDIIFLCRSGSRSSKAAEVVRRLGFQRIWHIKGGIALGTQPETIEQDDMEYVI
ncbi:MAG: aminotransferase class V-fold PLP-dependent enzyme [Fuerstiella sp.]